MRAWFYTCVFVYVYLCMCGGRACVYDLTFKIFIIDLQYLSFFKSDKQFCIVRRKELVISILQMICVHYCTQFVYNIVCFMISNLIRAGSLYWWLMNTFIILNISIWQMVCVYYCTPFVYNIVCFMSSNLIRAGSLYWSLMNTSSIFITHNYLQKKQISLG